MIYNSGNLIMEHKTFTMLGFKSWTVLSILIVFTQIQTSSQLNEGRTIFFNALKSTDRTDLVILMDRSFGMGVEAFYSEQKQLIRQILVEHALINEKYVKVSVITFAKDMEKIFDGISNNINKCEILEDGGLWNDVVYHEVQERYAKTLPIPALEEAQKILKNSRTSQSPPVKQFILLATDAAYDDKSNPASVIGSIENDNIYVNVIGLGPWLSVAKAQIFATNGSFYGGMKEWKNETTTYSVLAEDDSLAVDGSLSFEYSAGCRNDCSSSETCTCNTLTGYSSCSTPEDSCTSGVCQNGGTCVQGSHAFACRCLWGYTGMFCDINPNDCEPYHCQSNATCTDKVNGFKCNCPDEFEGQYCIDLKTENPPTPIPTSGTATDGDDDEDDDDNEEIPQWVIIVIPVVAFVLIVIIATITALVCKRCKRKRRSAGRPPSLSGLENPAIELPNTALETERPKRPDSLRKSKETPTRARYEVMVKTPTVPSQRPDLLDGLPARTGVSETYENLPFRQGMAEWQQYFSELPFEQISKICMIHSEANIFIASEKTIVLTEYDIESLRQTFSGKKTDFHLTVKDGDYFISENDGYILQGSGNRVDKNSGEVVEEVLIAAKTRQYYIIALSPRENYNGQCYIEVNWLREHIKGEGL